MVFYTGLYFIWIKCLINVSKALVLNFPSIDTQGAEKKDKKSNCMKYEFKDTKEQTEIIKSVDGQDHGQQNERKKKYTQHFTENLIWSIKLILFSLTHYFCSINNVLL